jgi:large repetitive protein
MGQYKILFLIVYLTYLSFLPYTVLAQTPEITSFKASNPYNQPNQAVTLEAIATGSSLEYKFDFGDGTQGTSWVKNSIISHVYSKPGHFVATLQVRSGNEVSDIKFYTVNVVPTGKNLWTQSSRNIAVDELSDNKIWAVNVDNDSVSFSRSSGEFEEVKLTENCKPQNVAVDTKSRAWVTCFGNDTIVIISSSGEIAHTIKLSYGSAPSALVIHKSGDFALVSLYQKAKLLSINTENFSILNSADIDATTRSIALYADGNKALVVPFITKDFQAQLSEFQISSNGQLTKSKNILIEEDLVSQDQVSAGRGILNYISSIAVHPSGEYALIIGKKDNIRRGKFLSNLNLIPENSVRSEVRRIDLVKNVEDFAKRRDIDNSEGPSSIIFSPFGDYSFITLRGQNEVIVLDEFSYPTAFNQINQIVLRTKVASAPTGLAFNSKNQRLYINNFLSRTASIFSISQFLQGFSQTLSDVNEKSLIKSEKLSPEVLFGKKVFYLAGDTGGTLGTNRMNSEGYLACATCHFEGGHDGQTWDFTDRGQGLRNTTDLRGRSGLKHGNVHWTANFDEIQDFENDIRKFFGGKGFMSEVDFQRTSDTLGAKKAGISKELDALASYVSSLDDKTYGRSPYRSPEGLLTTEGEKGRLLFSQLSCNVCHAGANFTDSELETPKIHAIGTIRDSSGSATKGIDTPTLRGLFDSAPYLHDGSALTLQEVFETVAGTTYQVEKSSQVVSGETSNKLPNYRGEGYLQLSNNGEFKLDLNQNIKMGSSLLEIRYFATKDATISVSIGDSNTIQAKMLASTSANAWKIARIEYQVTKLSNSQLQIKSDQTIAIDQVEIASDVQIAQSPHRKVLSLAKQDQEALKAFLLQLDSSEVSSTSPQPVPTKTVLPTPGLPALQKDFYTILKEIKSILQKNSTLADKVNDLKLIKQDISNFIERNQGNRSLRKNVRRLKSIFRIIKRFELKPSDRRMRMLSKKTNRMFEDLT